MYHFYNAKIPANPRQISDFEMSKNKRTSQIIKDSFSISGNGVDGYEMITVDTYCVTLLQ